MTNGVATILGGTNITFLPSTNFTGTAYVGYSISDGHGGTNSALITITVTGPVTPMADIAVLKSGLTNVAAGNAIAYTITVTNMGPLTATNVVLTDLMPSNTTFVSARRWNRLRRRTR